MHATATATRAERSQPGHVRGKGRLHIIHASMHPCHSTIATLLHAPTAVGPSLAERRPALEPHLHLSWTRCPRSLRGLHVAFGSTCKPCRFSPGQCWTPCWLPFPRHQHQHVFLGTNINMCAYPLVLRWRCTLQSIRHDTDQTWDLEHLDRVDASHYVDRQNDDRNINKRCLAGEQCP